MLIINLLNHVIIARHTFKSAITDAAFHPTGDMIAIAFHRTIQIWRTPSINYTFNPFILLRSITLHHDTITCLSWSPNGSYLLTGSRDLTAKIFFIDTLSTLLSKAKNKVEYIPVTLSGHRDILVGVYYGDNDTIYTISADGALMIWIWQETAIQNQDEENSDDDSESILALENTTTTTTNTNLTTLNSSTTSHKRARESSSSSSSTGLTLPSSTSSLQSKQKHTVPAPYTALSSSSSHDITQGEWRLQKRHYLRQEGGTTITTTAYHIGRSLLVIGLSDGVFGIYSMPLCEVLHTLSISKYPISTTAINASGDWLAFGSAPLSQLLVWEWTSETYVIKQQGHGQGVSCTAFSPNGQLVVTGGEDGRVKIWSTSYGFAFVTFTEHTASITGVTFAGGRSGNGTQKGVSGGSHGLIVLSASLDGTVRAYDLVRYRNFRTFTTPPGEPMVQFSCIASDEGGEIVAAGGFDPFNIYIWSLQTGKLLDVLSGHEGPISSLSYSSAKGLLASSSWDKTIKVWDIYRNGTATESFLQGSDVTAVAFRPDGIQLAASAIDGNIALWDIQRGVQLSSIDIRRDLQGGRHKDDARSANATLSRQHATSLCYTADGNALLVGGNSRFVCLYALPSKMLIRRFVLTHNRDIEGTQDKLRSDQQDTWGNIPTTNNNSSMTTTNSFTTRRNNSIMDDLPGVKKGDEASKRNRIRTAWSKSVTFSPAGDAFSAVTPDGVALYHTVTDEGKGGIFDPVELGEDITLDSIEEASNHGQHARALLMALHLNEEKGIRYVINNNVPLDVLPIIVHALPRGGPFISRLLHYMAKLLSPVSEDRETENAPINMHLEYVLCWCLTILQEFRDYLWKYGSLTSTNNSSTTDSTSTSALGPALAAIQKALILHRETLSKLVERNGYLLDFLVGERNYQSKNGGMIEQKKNVESEELDIMEEEIE